MRTLIAIPCMDEMPIEFVDSLLCLEPVGETMRHFIRGSLVYDARNRLCGEAVENKCDYILFIDSDMVFEPDMLKRMMEDIKGRDIVCGLFFTRKSIPYKPCIYKHLGYTMDLDTGKLGPSSELYFDYPKDQIFEVDGCGFGAVLMRTEVVKKIKETDGLPFSPVRGFGEDLSFCIKAKKAGFKIHCDSRIKVGHVGRIVIDEKLVERTNKYADTNIIGQN